MIKQTKSKTRMEDSEFRLAVIGALVKLETTSSKLKKQNIRFELPDDLESRVCQNIDDITNHVISLHNAMAKISLPNDEKEALLLKMESLVKMGSESHQFIKNTFED